MLKSDATLGHFTCGGEAVIFHRLSALEGVRGGPMSELPYVVRILLESVMRHQGEALFRWGHVEALARWGGGGGGGEIPYLPGRVLLQDLTGVPCVVDLASLRSAVARAGGDARRVEPRVPVDMVVDHSVQLDYAGCGEALGENMRIEFERNRERYEFLRWGQGAFQKLRIVPPGVGICHQVNLEFLASGVRTERGGDGRLLAFPDTLVGTDSHTTMVNGLGVMGWGVGGIEAEAVMLGRPISLLLPVVTGVCLRGRLGPGVTATDLALALTERLRGVGVVGQFVEYIGDGCRGLTPADRAVVANMAPEYGATTGFFPMDAATIRYLRMTGRSELHCKLVERYMREQGLFREEGSPEPQYSRRVEVDLGEVEPAVAGPKRPHEHQTLSALKGRFLGALRAGVGEGGFGVRADALGAEVELTSGEKVRHGSVVIASITSCTNTSNPALLLTAGLVAKKAVAKGLRPPGYVKTSLVPGSRVVAAYLRRTGLLGELEKLGFGVAAYGCGTCIGNSGPLAEEVAAGIRGKDLVVAAVLSGNRNFEGRVHPACKANYLCSPPLVVAYALAGRVDIDLAREPLGRDGDGAGIYLKDLWPTAAEWEGLRMEAEDPALYAEVYRDIGVYTPAWGAIPALGGVTFPWRAGSTYIREAPFLEVGAPDPEIRGARVLCLLGDFITTDHISPAGVIGEGSPAARYLAAHGVQVGAFNTYGSRRGNHEVMVRGTFANIRLKNRMAGREGGWTRHQPDGEEMSIFDAAEAYRREGTPVVVVAGKMYGAGSSRDWAAKGPMLLGVRVVLAESFERIHRSNLVEMGILPLEFMAGETAMGLGLDGTETFSFSLEGGEMRSRARHRVTAVKAGGEEVRFWACNRIETPMEEAYYRAGGILPFTLRHFLGTGA